MAHRPGILTTVQHRTEGGRRRNASVGRLQAKVRCHWTPYAAWSEIEEIIKAAAREALAEAQVKYQAEGYPWPVGIGEMRRG